MKKAFVFLLFLTTAATFAQQFSEEAVLTFQKELNAEYADATESPLMPEDRKEFKSLDFFSPNQNFYVVAKFVRTPDEKPFEMPTTGSRRPMYVKYAEAIFSLDGKQFRLNIYQSVDLTKKAGFEDYLFMPFTDLTSGVETYGGGRYIDLRIPKGDTIVIDFNQAYNPYCAYSHKYSCPIPPKENDLQIEIKAGVKKFHD
ncbi:DUF1684 domain-containing protein [Flavobacterium sp. 3HN19-14]|uniref:DUF1684 domain-containing protein n=1 Tax=Flavobacterium sp. 3HN19-14 TaxID=3448133 RepID=UPI003EE046C2